MVDQQSIIVSVSIEYSYTYEGWIIIVDCASIILGIIRGRKHKA